MAANTDPIFTLSPIAGYANFGTANTNRDGSGTLGTLLTAGSNGARVTNFRFQATGTTTAGVIRLYKYDGSTTARLLKEIIVAAVTPSTSVEAWSGEWKPTFPIVLPSGYSIRVSTNNAETFNGFADAGDF